jgi:hypothetical protein
MSSPITQTFSAARNDDEPSLPPCNDDEPSLPAPDEVPDEVVEYQRLRALVRSANVRLDELREPVQRYIEALPSHTLRLGTSTMQIRSRRSYAPITQCSLMTQLHKSTTLSPKVIHDVVHEVWASRTSSESRHVRTT